MPLARILVVEDDSAIRRGVCDALRFGGYEPLEAADGREGFEAATEAGVDLVLLDITMPERDGLSVLEELRRIRPGLPVIFLTARGEAEDRVRGLRLGADDYVVKPFNAGELLARVEAVLRRSAERPRPVPELHIAGRAVDFARREVAFPDGRRALLAQREAEVLEYLAANRGRAISRDELLRRVWGIDPRGAQTRTVDMAIARLREQLGDDSARPAVVLTVRGQGYMLGPVEAPPGSGPGS
jgi:two-component system, OmpR family, alkaline phosphatase synthesis response regulator PhoP